MAFNFYHTKQPALTEHSVCISPMLKISNGSFNLILATTAKGHSHFTDNKAKTQKGLKLCQGNTNWKWQSGHKTQTSALSQCVPLPSTGSKQLDTAVGWMHWDQGHERNSTLTSMHQNEGVLKLHTVQTQESWDLRHTNSWQALAKGGGEAVEMSCTLCSGVTFLQL